MHNGDQIADSIQKFLKDNSILYNFIEHEPTPTSEDAARVRGTSIHEGAKALILVTSKEKKNYMAVLPGDMKLDSKKMKKLLGDSFSFEKPEIILEKYGLIIGGIPPFGFLLGIETFYENSILENENVSFNCGTRTKSVGMTVKDFQKIVKGRWESFSSL